MIKPIIIYLTTDEQAWCIETAKAIHQEAKRRGANPGYGLQANDELQLSFHIIGVSGEFVVSKYTGLRSQHGYNHKRRRNEPALGDNVQVLTRSKHYYDLIVRPDNNPDFIYVLVTTEDRREFHLHGWIHGCDATKPEFWKEGVADRPSAWFVPKQALHPMDPLPGGPARKPSNESLPLFDGQVNHQPQESNNNDRS
jgi:hypothetical protein